MIRCAEVGFKVLDINFCHAIYGKTDLYEERWLNIIEDLRNEADKLGIVFTQSHPVFISGNIKDYDEGFQVHYWEMMRRSIIASSILGVKWVILHPMDDNKATDFDIDANIQKNMEMHEFAIELAMKHNVGIAYENMIEGPGTKRRFCSEANELVALIDAFQDSRIGACWDFGHGNFLYKDQRNALRTLGKRLKATHVNDNNGAGDDHLYPFHGNVNWHELLPVLKEIGYAGDFTYETHKETNRLPDYLKDQVAKVGYDIGQYCLAIIEEG